MDTSTILWVDLQTAPAAVDLSAEASQFCRIFKLREPDRLAAMVRAKSPCALIFEYDRPHPELLEFLKWSAEEFPDLPVVMITEQHSESLAVWALRARVWDYLVKPVDRSYLASCIKTLLQHASNRIPPSDESSRGASKPIAIGDDNERSDRSQKLDCNRETPEEWESRLTPALAFVKSNFAEKVTLGDVAQLCGLGRYQFSRAFKQAHGKTFREFLIIHRIQKAVQMLCFADASITDVAFSVGFNDLSHFAEMFRRYVGVRPSDYVQETKSKTVRLAPAFVGASGGALQNSRRPFAKES